MLKLLSAFKLTPFKNKLFLALGLVFSTFYSVAFAQRNQSYIQVQFGNDNAGEISNWLNTGDDIGKTHSMLISVNLQDHNAKNNYTFSLESTEYSNFDYSTKVEKDIVFSEHNKLQVSINNNSFINKTNFYELALGINYLQGNKITFGATGQKYIIHKYLLDKFYYQKNWEYNTSGIKDTFIPELNLKYGYNLEILKSKHLLINTLSSTVLQYSTDTNYRGLGAMTRATFVAKELIKNDKVPQFEFELEAAYLANVTKYKNIYYKAGLGLAFDKFAIYFQVVDPLQKNLSNPYLVYDDLELNFNYGLLVNI